MPNLRMERIRSEAKSLLGLRDHILQVSRVRKEG